MIKEKDKKKKYEKTPIQIVKEYLKTIFVSFLVALVVTTILSIRAREEMIKNLYITAAERQKMDELIAKQLVAQSDLTENLATKNYTICMQVGGLYEAAKDYPNAQIAYEKAVERAKPGNYTPYYKLTSVLIAQDKFEDADKLIRSVADIKNKSLIKFKTRSYIEMGDKYYSIGKFLKAARSYEKAKYYYGRFSKRDKKIDDSITKRIVNSYTEASTILVKEGYNSDAVRFLEKALKYAPDNFYIKYKLAIIYSDLDPVLSIEYFEPLIKKMPQHIDYSTYNKALLKAANICELEGNLTKAKFYRYKSHSIDLMINNKVIYKNDIEVIMNSFTVKKFLFRYRLKGDYKFRNVSNADIYRMFADFVLKEKDKVKETVTVQCVTKQKPLFSNGEDTDDIVVKLGKNIFTKRELGDYTIDIYVYKDEKYKTLLGTYAIPDKNVKNETDKLKDAFDKIME